VDYHLLERWNTELELQALPRSGGEKNYLEYVYKHPRFMATCVCAMYGLLIVSYSHTTAFLPHRRLGVGIRYSGCLW